MTDIRLVQNKGPLSVSLDWSLKVDGTLDETQELATAVILALGTDSLAAADDTLPGLDDDDRRGWWGDSDAAEIWGGWPIGSRLWLLTRSKITDATVPLVELYVYEALRPFVDRRIASRVVVEAERSTVDRNRIDCIVIVYRGPLPAVELRYQILWNEITGNPSR